MIELRRTLNGDFPPEQAILSASRAGMIAFFGILRHFTHRSLILDRLAPRQLVRSLPSEAFATGTLRPGTSQME
jgi:hypothetical protein